MVARASLQALARVPIYSQPLGPKGGRVRFLINLENTGSGGGQNASFLKAPGGSRRVLKNSGNEGSMRALEGSWPNVTMIMSLQKTAVYAPDSHLEHKQCFWPTLFQAW